MEAPARQPDEPPTAASPSTAGHRTDFRRIVDGVPGCILVADAKGQIVYANKVAIANLGRPLEDLLGDGWLKSVDPSFLGEARSQWDQCIRTNEPLNVTWRFRQHNGDYRWHHIKAEPTTDNDGKTIAWYLLGVDVDEQSKHKKLLRPVNKRLERFSTVFRP